ncbi:MBL fold metallo-hydrolase [Aeromicrobium phragmitis]|uniref:MBL fold metallo-hydrolase n=1 Tax=Aeromicrobium phragmitis TaxID=2478914 RepID=UPI001407BE14|nr:MBL fold metallo-hydrolase [Aeromicrobium phragmitis]
MSDVAAVWWGHATSTVELDGRRVLTDPVFADRLMHLRRRTPTPAPEALEADLVVVSHLHPDHFHVPSLRRLRRGTTVLVPRNGGRLLRGAGLDVDEVTSGTVATSTGLRIEVTPAAHSDQRHHGSRLRGEPLGFVVRGRRSSVWYPGDTALADHIDDVRDIDLALVPVGGWGPTLGKGHMDPAAAAEAVRRVGARWAVPVHWGTFWPIGMRRWASTYHRLFRMPGRRFVEAVDAGADVSLAPHGARLRWEELGG